MEFVARPVDAASVKERVNTKYNKPKKGGRNNGPSRVENKREESQRARSGGDAVKKSVKEIYDEMEGVKKEMHDVTTDLRETTARLVEAKSIADVAMEESDVNLRLSAMSLDLWIGDPWIEINWDWILITLTVVMWIASCGANWYPAEMTLCLCGILAVHFYHPYHKRIGGKKVRDSRGRRILLWRIPINRFLLRRHEGERHLTFVRFQSELGHVDERHDSNKLRKLEHANPLYAVIMVESFDETDEWVVSTELLSQLLAPKYQAVHEEPRLVYERIMRDAARFHTVNIGRYRNWTENVYTATAHVAYAYYLASRARRMQDFVLAPPPLNV